MARGGSSPWVVESVVAALISRRSGNDVDSRGGQEKRGVGRGAQSHSRRDEDWGGREKGHSGDSNALLMARQGGT
jgi:hypothetical protein